MGKPVVWVTGASSGIGKSIALLLAENNYEVIVSSRNKSELEKYLANENDNIHVFPLDITDAEKVEKTIEKIQKDFEIDCLINNAGVTVFKSVVDSTEEDLTALINTNLIGAIRLSQKVLPGMIQRRKGTIINILSVAAEAVFQKSGIYSASKAGLKAFAKVLREELREFNIKVINVYPGATRTPIWPNFALENYGEKMMSPEDIAKIIFNVYITEGSAVFEEIFIRPMHGDLK